MDGIKKGILKGFLELDEKLRKIPEVASGEDKSGTTAVCALISQKYLIIANCGDSRGVCCTSGKPVLATQVVRELSFFKEYFHIHRFLLVGPQAIKRAREGTYSECWRICHDTESERISRRVQGSRRF